LPRGDESLLLTVQIVIAVIMSLVVSALA